MAPKSRPLIEVRKPPVDAVFALYLPQVTGKCRWCGEPTDEPGRKVWHSACQQEFRIIIDPAAARQAVFERDRSHCVDCGETKEKWHNDHKVPLFRVVTMLPLERLQYFKLENMVTRCEDCHHDKTGDEATDRAHIVRLETSRIERDLIGKVDLTGKRFGKLCISGKSHVDQRGQTLWKAICDCGTETVVRGAHLKGGQTRSCGCGRPLLRLVGQRFTRLLVQAREDNDHGKTTWRCLCDCGNVVIVAAQHLQRGATKSCGCLAREYQKGNQAGRTHGHAGRSKTRAYNSWAGMLQRCQNENNPKYKDYGGRGIIVCERWKTFEAFYQDMGDPPGNRTLDRRDVNGNYELGNCRWATVKEQQNNRRISKWPKRSMRGPERRPAKDINDP